MKKAAILGGGLDQKKLVQEFNKRGYKTILFDYYEDPPAKSISSKHYQISTYDADAVLDICKTEQIEVIATISTDQPLLTAAYVSEKLGLYHPLSYEQAKNLTDKEYMKDLLVKGDILTPKHIIVDSVSNVHDLKKPRFPLVVKPVDSSGARGVSFLYTQNELNECCELALEQSRAGKVVIEEKIDGVLVSVDALVVDDKVEAILISENAVFEDKPGLFRKTTYPSVIGEKAITQIQLALQKISSAFDLNNCPLFVQFIVTAEDEVYVMELSARIAGGSKPYLVPLLTGVDIVNAYVSQLLRIRPIFQKQSYSGHFSCNYIWSDRAGTIKKLEGLEELLKRKIIEQFGLFKGPGDSVAGRGNGADRIGYFYILDQNLSAIKSKTEQVDQHLKILDETGIDMMMHGIYN